jgi:hypothetical protein
LSEVREYVARMKLSLEEADLTGFARDCHQIRVMLDSIIHSEKGMSAEEIDRVVSDLGRVAGVGDLYDRALGAIGDLRQQHASNDAATDKLIDALVAMVERNGGKMVNLPGWDGVSLAFHEHPRSHVERNAADSRRTSDG